MVFVISSELIQAYNYRTVAAHGVCALRTLTADSCARVVALSSENGAPRVLNNNVTRTLNAGGVTGT